MLGSLVAGALCPPSARSGSTGGMEVRGATFCPALRSRWCAAVAVNAREAANLEAVFGEGQNGVFQSAMQIPEGLIAIVCAMPVDKMHKSSKPLLYQY